MRRSLRLAFCLAAVLPARVALADDDSDIKVDVVVDMTDAGKKVAHPSPGHPAYFYPITRGYSLGEGVVPGEKPPPPTVEVQRLIAKALADQGYLLATKISPPSLLFMFWWGYKAPVMQGATNGGAAELGSQNTGAIGGPLFAKVGPQLGINEAAQSGVLPTNVMNNEYEMEDLVFGSNYDRNTNEFVPTLRMQALKDESRIARYYVTVSALDYAAATQQKKAVVLWTAHMSTDLYGHTLDQVLPSLIAAGAGMFGKDTHGALWPLPTVPLVPMGRVVVGAPYVKTDLSQPPAPAANRSP